MTGAVTGIAAPPGVGKTTFAFQLALAFALDMPFGPWHPRPGGGGKVWLYNGEEPKDELDRRFMAACNVGGVQEANASKRFDYNSGLSRRLRLGEQVDRGRFVRNPDVDIIKKIIQERKYKLLILDPLIEFHDAKENDIEAFGRVAAVCREIATDCDCAVLIFHHTPKSASGDTAAGEMNALRGGGPLAGVARFVLTMFAMTQKDAQAFGVSAEDRPSFVRLDGAKANMAAVQGGPIWWRKLGVSLENADEVRPADIVGVLRIADLKSAASDPREANVRRVAAAETEVYRLAKEVVRVCVANGYTSPENATSLTNLCEALDANATGMKATKARGLIVGKMAPAFDCEGQQIIITNTYKGTMQFRRVHLQAVNSAN